MNTFIRRQLQQLQYSVQQVHCTVVANRTERDREYKQKSTTNATYEQRNTP